MTENQSLPVGEALRMVAQEVGAIAKAQRVTEGPARYMFRGVDDVYQAIHDPMAKWGVSFVPTGVVIHDQTVGTTKKGSPQQHLLATVTYQIVGPQGDAIAAAVLAESQDTSDKAASKLMSMAYKYLAFQVLSIPVEGAMDESDREATERAVAGPPRITPDQKRALWNLPGIEQNVQAVAAAVAGVLGVDVEPSPQAFLVSLTEEQAQAAIDALSSRESTTGRLRERITDLTNGNKEDTNANADGDAAQDPVVQPEDENQEVTGE